MNYQWKDFEKDTKTLENIIKAFSNPHIVVPYKGGLPLGTVLSNRLNIKLSILKMQMYADVDKKATWIYNADVLEGETIVLLDDLYDKGNTLLECLDLLRKSYPNNMIVIYTIFGRKGEYPIHNYLHEHPQTWVEFPWE